MPNRHGLTKRKQSVQPRSFAEHQNRGPAAGTIAYNKIIQQKHRNLFSGQQPLDAAAPMVEEEPLTLSQQASTKLASAQIAAALSTDDRTLLEAAVHRLLRPHQPASGQAGGLQRSSSGNKAVTDVLDMLRKLGQQLQQTKAEAEAKIEGLEKDAAEALDWWVSADEMLKELRVEDAELKQSIEEMAADTAKLKHDLTNAKRQLTLEKSKPKLPQGRKDDAKKFVPRACVRGCGCGCGCVCVCVCVCVMLDRCTVLTHLVVHRRALRDRVRESLEAFRQSNPGDGNLNGVLAEMVLREKCVCLCACVSALACLVWPDACLLCRGALEEVLRRGRVFEKLELELRTLRKAQKKDPAEAALFEGARIEAGPSRNQAMSFIDLLTFDEGASGADVSWLRCAQPFHRS